MDETRLSSRGGEFCFADVEFVYVRPPMPLPIPQSPGWYRVQTQDKDL